jgi:hypothetical protein
MLVNTCRCCKVYDLKLCDCRHFILHLSSTFLHGMSEYELIACASVASCPLIKVHLKINEVFV